MNDRFDASLTPLEICALCARFGLPVPPAVAHADVPALCDSDRADAFGRALSGLARRGVVGLQGDDLTGATDLATALALLARPDMLVGMLRGTRASVRAASIGLAGTRAAELLPAADGGHSVRLFPAEEALDHVIAFCELADGASVDVPPLLITPAGLLAAAELSGAEDPAGGRELLGDAPHESRRAFLVALASKRAGCQVTVLDRRERGRLRGTVTAWLDAGNAGLWRIPPTDLGGPGGGFDERAVHALPLEVVAVTQAELVAEITEGFPELQPP